VPAYVSGQLARGEGPPVLALNEKIRGLVQLLEAGLPVPDALFLDEAEYEHYVRHQALSSATSEAIARFVASVREAGHVPLFSVRCDSKLGPVSTYTPHSLLCVGLRTIERGRVEQFWGGREVPWPLFEQVFRERASRLSPRVLEASPGATLHEELCLWLREIYEKLRGASQPHSACVVIQRMVFGCLDARSGNGICCNHPGEPHPSRRFKGVFMPQQLGISLVRGSWGTTDVNLSELRNIHPRAYFELRGMFDYLEEFHGPDRYLEFTIEGERLFLLQHSTRQRLVAAG
jgi:hypothetical protein